MTQTSSGTPGLSSISSACGFTKTSYNAATASIAAASVTVTATKPGSNQVVTVSPSATVNAATSSVAVSTTSKAAAPMRSMGMGIIVAAMGAPFAIQAM